MSIRDFQKIARNKKNCLKLNFWLKEMTFTYIHHHNSIRQIIRKNIIGPLFDTLGTGLYKYHKVVSIFCSVQVCFNPNVTARLHFELLLSLWLFSIKSHEHFSCTTDSVWFTVYRQCDLGRIDAIPYCV